MPSMVAPVAQPRTRSGLSRSRSATMRAARRSAALGVGRMRISTRPSYPRRADLSQQHGVVLTGGGPKPGLERPRLFECVLGGCLLTTGQRVLGGALEGEDVHLEGLGEALLVS